MLPTYGKIILKRNGLQHAVITIIIILPIHILIVSIDLFTAAYVDAIQDLLLSLSCKTLKEKLKKYEKKVPKPLNSKFPEKLKKTEAITKYEDKKKGSKTSLFPTGKVIYQFCSLIPL